MVANKSLHQQCALCRAAGCCERVETRTDGEGMGKKEHTSWAGTRLGEEPKYGQWKCHSQVEAHKAGLKSWNN